MNPLNTMDTAAHVDGARLAARLDRLPVISPHIVWISILAINLALEYYDNALFAYVLPSIAENTGLSLPQLGTVGSAFFIGMVVGALAGGRLSDRFGRRQILVWATVVYSAGALATAFATSFEVMMFARFITGLGVQAATSVLLVYVAEMFPSKTRGRFASVLTTGFVVVAPLVAFLAMVAIPNGGPDTWRHLFVIGSVGLVIAPLARYVLPESVRWQISRGQWDKAEALVSKLEAIASRRGPLAEPAVVSEAPLEKRSLRAVFANPQIVRVLAIVGIGYFGSTLGYYLFGNWALYSLVEGLRYEEGKAYEIQLVWNVVYCVTPLVALALMDRFERKTLIFGGAIASAIPLVLLGVSTQSWVVTTAGGAAAIMTGLVINVYFAYIPEAMPPQGRGLGTGIVIGIGRLGGAASGVLGAALFGRWNIGGVMIAAAACYIVFSAVVLLFGPRTTQRSLEGVAVEN
ncbi:MFS transporter [Nocardia amikacinitolerans]|uniref:MFS transporter n=1 Tax=Nocardia amikacinitolerans TaxID=756689 RepID=UPI0020A35961|nr:MFS transporter [Nocardia amikacinitolerans]MCP2279673.1 MFS transporter, putative metabolite:H+ symporter [Nocardia amikacinitolerans]